MAMQWSLGDFSGINSNRNSVKYHLQTILHEICVHPPTYPTENTFFGQNSFLDHLVIIGVWEDIFVPSLVFSTEKLISWVMGSVCMWYTANMLTNHSIYAKNCKIEPKLTFARHILFVGCFFEMFPWNTPAKSILISKQWRNSPQSHWLTFPEWHKKSWN